MPDSGSGFAIGSAVGIEAGTQVGNYRVVRSLGRGGMAEVFEAEDLGLGRKVALKVLPAAATDDPETLQRFAKEARAVAALNHRGIVTVFEVGHDKAFHFFSMRLLSGGDLLKRIKAGLDPDEALHIVRELAAAFAHAHKHGFVHRDVKPGNVIFDDQGHPVLTDFGIAKALDSGTQLTRTGLVIGTPRYISPEQAAGRTVDARSDLYSLGVMLFEMLTGKPPYDAPDGMALMQKHLAAPIPKLPKAFAKWQPLIEGLMAKDPAHRFASAEELIVQIDALSAKAAETGKGPRLTHTNRKLALKDKAVASPEMADRIAKQLAGDPENQGLRFELLRLYADLERTEDFLKEARVLRYAQQGLNPSHWEVIEQMGRKLAPLSPLFQDSGKTLSMDVIAFDAEEFSDKRKHQRIGEYPPEARALFAKLAADYKKLRATPRFFTGLELDLVRTGLRATPLVHAQQLSRRLGGARLLMKREDLGSGGHAMIAAVGQVYVARSLGRKRVVAGIRDVRIGVLLATAAAPFGLTVDLWLDRDEYDRQSSSIFQLKRLGAKLHPVHVVNYRNRDIREAALQEWLKHPDEVFWFLGLDAGPDPMGAIASDLVSVIGRECRRQVEAQTGQLPDIVAARGGDFPDALGLFPAFLDDASVSRVCVDAADVRGSRKAKGRDEYDPFAKPLNTMQLSTARAILGGVEYVSVRREFKSLEATGRIERRSTDLATALKVHEDVATLEGVLLGLQTSYVMAWACEKARTMDPKQIVIVLVAEGGENDLWEIERLDRELRPQAKVADPVPEPSVRTTRR